MSKGNDIQTAFKLLSDDPWYSVLKNRLNKQEIEECKSFASFLDDNGLTASDAEKHINRWMLDHETKPKRWSIMKELLMASNTKVSFKRPD